MRFKTFLESQDESALKLFDGFKHNLTTMIQSKQMLYRGATFERKHQLMPGVFVSKFNARTTPRNSQTRDNTLMHLAKEWKGFPDRQFSSFATQFAPHAAGFDTPYILIPADSVKTFGWMPGDFNLPSNKEKSSKEASIKLTNTVKILIIAVLMVFNNRKDEAKTEFRNTVINFAEDCHVWDILKNAEYLPKFSETERPNIIAFCDKLISRQKELKRLYDPKRTAELAVMNEIWDAMEFIESEGFSSIKDGLNSSVSPEGFNAKSISSLSEMPHHKPSEELPGELWFEGAYLLVSLGFDLETSSVEKQLNVLRKIEEMLK